MEDRATPRMHKYGETKTTRIMMATIRQVTSSSGLRKFQAAWFLLNRGYIHGYKRSGGAFYLHMPSDDGGSRAGQIICTHHLDYSVP